MPVPIWAGRYIGLPFKGHGRDRSGLDCWGLVRLVLGEQYGYALPSLATEYKSTAEAQKISALVESQLPFWREITAGREKTGDVIILRLKGHPMHVGLVLGDGSMLHIEQGIDSAIERYAAPRWQNRIYGFYRYETFHHTDKSPSGKSPSGKSPFGIRIPAS